MEKIPGAILLHDMMGQVRAEMNVTSNHKQAMEEQMGDNEWVQREKERAAIINWSRDDGGPYDGC